MRSLLGWVLLLSAVGCGGGGRATGICPLGQTQCGDACIDLQNDANHCGRCGNDCGSSACLSGFCSLQPATDGGTICSATQSMCDGRCVSLLSDANNCGACGNTCAQGQECSQGTCADPCSPYASCSVSGSSYCADLSHDASNCGACGNRCGAGFVCSQGACAPNCGVGESACPTVNPTYCASLPSDEMNCGGCGIVCAAGMTCNSGSCGCPGGATQSAVCQGQCVDLDDDAANCGGCGLSCNTAIGETCSAGSCGCPGVDPDVCGGACVDLANSVANCGGCGQACAVGESCLSGVCGIPTLINIDFASNDPSSKVGLAATGLGASDYWNWFPSADDLTRPMQWSDQSPSPVSIRTQGLTGSWGTGNAEQPDDPMYEGYLYNSCGPVSVLDLPTATYDFYLYAVSGWSGGYTLTVKDSVGAIVTTYPTRRVSATNIPATFTEGFQYVKFANVAITAGQKVEVTMEMADGYCYISGAQILAH